MAKSVIYSVRLFGDTDKINYICNILFQRLQVGGEQSIIYNSR